MVSNSTATARIRLILAAAFALLLAATLVVAAAPTADAAEPDKARSSDAEIEAKAVAAMVDNLDVSRSEARDRLDAQQAQTKLAERLTKELGERAAGTYIDADTGELTVNVRDAAAATQVREAGAVAMQVDHDLGDLERAQRKLERRNAPNGVSWAVDVPTNSVVVSVPQGRRNAETRRFVRAAKRLDVPVTIQKVAGPAAVQAFYGGEAIFGSGGGRCSAGFITSSRSGRQYVVTAGHCTDAASSWSGDGQTIGATAASSFPGNDFGAIRINNPGALDPRGGVINGGGTTDITGTGRVPVGATVCKSGSTSGTTCGQVLRYNATVNYREGQVREMTESNTCTGPGDSGGALFAGSQAQGVVSGGSIAGCGSSGFRSYFQPVDEVLNTYGLTLR